MPKAGDKIRLRATMVMTLEWDADPVDYVEDGGEVTVAEMIEMDQGSLDDDAYGFFSQEGTESTTKVELVAISTAAATGERQEP